MSAPKPNGTFKVSVVVPVYNTAEYLPECLDSLVGQSIGLDAIQIVIVDDGSTDGSDEVVKAYAERYPANIVCLSQENGGQGAARNLGLSRCEGEYVGFMDSDDFADVNMYEAMYAAAKEADADMCVCGIDSFCDEGGKRVSGMQCQLPPNPLTPMSLFLAPQTQPPIRLVRRRMLVNNGVRFPVTRGSEDNGFHFKMAPFCQTVVAVRAPMIRRRLRSESTASTISAAFCEQFFSVADDVLEFYSEHGLFDDYGELLEAALVRMLLCSRLGCIGLVEGRVMRGALTDKTLDYIEKHFPHRKKNRYLSGLMGLYLKNAGRLTVGLSRAFFAARYKQLICIGG
ncbi:MAG: glycosyltransferase family 2 protein [Coriobacteriia bacterium]|nr:glycosyltransferase family 2 protein [Coriobacteriia bacterium]